MGRGEPGFLRLTVANVEHEHICCAIAGKEHQEGVERKKAFLSQGFERGLAFRKLDVRGKRRPRSGPSARFSTAGCSPTSR